MSGRGGNLSQPLKKVLINVPSPENLGTYRQASNNVQILQFTTHGYSLPVLTGSTLRVTQPQPAIMRISTVQLSNVAPVNPNSYDFGITVIKRHRRPGIGNRDFTDHSVFYGGNRRVTPAGITNAELNEMRNEIVRQINSDNGQIQSLPHTLPGAAVVATPILLLSAWNAASAMTIDTRVVAAGATIAAFIANINAHAGYFAWANPAAPTTEIFVIKTTRATSPNTVPVFVSTGGTIVVSGTQPNGFFALTQRYADAHHEVQVLRGTGTHNILVRGRFALLTNADVERTFSYIPNDGILAQQRRHPNTVLPGVDYVKINIDVPQSHYDLQGASHVGTFITSVEVYMPAAEWNVGIGQAVNRRWAALVSNRMIDAGTASNVRDLIAATGIPVI